MTNEPASTEPPRCEAHHPETGFQCARVVPPHTGYPHIAYDGSTWDDETTQEAAPPAKVTAPRFKCVLIRADAPECTEIALVTIIDAEGGKARACLKHAIAALEGIKGARVDWADSRGLNEFAVKALELTEEKVR